MRNSYSQVPHSTENAGVEIERQIAKKSKWKLGEETFAIA